MIKLLKVEVAAFERKAKGKRMFKWRKPTVILSKLPGDCARLYIDFSERWNFACSGGGSNSKGEYYEVLGFSNLNDEDPVNTPYDGFEIRLFFNKPVEIIGQNGKRYWEGYIQSCRSWKQTMKNVNKKKCVQIINTGKGQ